MSRECAKERWYREKYSVADAIDCELVDSTENDELVCWLFFGVKRHTALPQKKGVLTTANAAKV